MTPEQYIKDKRYLPDCLKDFHAQKDLFKTIQNLYKDSESLKRMPQSWVDNHVYVIDYFLWFMGQHGYKLQRDRSNVDFYNLQSTIDYHKQNMAQSLFEILANHLTNENGDKGQ